MKRSLVTLVFISLSSSLALAQSTMAPVACQPQQSANTAQQINSNVSGEYVPLNNTPFFPDGQKALTSYFLNPDLYPHSARMNDTEGTVQVRFRVQPNGYLTHIRVVESHGRVLDKAALRTVAGMPRWYPALQGRHDHCLPCSARHPVRGRLKSSVCSRL